MRANYDFRGGRKNPYPELIAGPGEPSAELGYAFSRTKLPKGLSYPLKRSVLDQAIKAAGVNIVGCVRFTRPARGRDAAIPLILAIYSGSGLKDYAFAGSAYVYFYSVPSVQRHAIEQALLGNGLGRLMQWLKSIQCSGNTRAGANQDFSATYDGGVLMINAT